MRVNLGKKYFRLAHCAAIVLEDKPHLTCEWSQKDSATWKRTTRTVFEINLCAVPSTPQAEHHASQNLSERKESRWQCYSETFIMLSIRLIGFRQSSQPDTLAVLLSLSLARRPLIRCLNSWGIRRARPTSPLFFLFVLDNNGDCAFEQCRDTLLRHRVVKARCFFLFLMCLSSA